MKPMFSPPGQLSRLPLLAAAVLLLVPTGALARQEKVVLSVKGEVGATSRHRTVSKVAISADGETINMESTDEYEVKVLKKEGGLITFESKTLSSVLTIEGEKMENEEEEEDKGSEFTLKANGELASFKDRDEEADEDTSALSLRMAQASSVVFKATAVGAGDAWSHTFAENKELKTPAGKADYKLVGLEQVGGSQAAKIEITYTETGSAKAIKASGTVFIEVASGESVKSDMKYENVPFDFGSGEDITASSTDSSERLSGSLVALKAQPTAPTTAPAAGQQAPAAEPKKEEPKKEEPKKEEDKNSIDVKTKGWEKMEGLFTIYRKVESGRTRINLEIKKSQLNTLFVLQTTLSTGSGDRAVPGNPVSDLVFEFRESPNNKIFLTVPNYYWRAPKNPEIEKAIRRSFTDSIVESFDIEGTQKERDSILIDISSTFTGNIGRLFEQVAGGGGGGLASLMGGGTSFSPDREKTFIKTLKVFPTNIYVESNYAFTSSSRGSFDPFETYTGEVPTLADSRAMAVTVVYNLFQLPSASSYQPRRGDRRVGYFNVVHRDWSNPGAMDQKVENILRWDLKKKDPSQPLSEPVQPIVFHVDSAFSERQRKIVRDALLSWNEAFEAIGFKNAVQVHLMDEKSDFDHADMRYNVVRLVASPGSAYAVALFRSNPLTGQILNASITLDANYLRAVEGDWDANSPAEAFEAARKKLDQMSSPAKDDHDHEHGDNCAVCSYQKEASQRAAFAYLAVALSGGAIDMERKQQFVDEFLYHVVQHEFGHILGLRHNFVASTQLSPEQLKNPEMVKKHNITASVMDYVDFNNYALGKKDIPFFGKRIGDYDRWAVRYGYFITGIPDPDEDAKFLKAVAAQGSKWGLEYQSDEEADGLDPFTRRFDLSSDPLSRAQDMMALSKRLLMTLGERKPVAGQSYFEFTRAFNILLSRMASSAGEASTYLGGVRRSFAFAGDAGARMPFSPVEGAQQRKALDLLLSNLFDEKAFDFPKSYYRMMASDPKGSMMDNMLDAMETYPMFDMVSRLQTSALSATMNTGLLRRLINEEWKAEKGTDVLRAAEVMKKVRDAVWVELDKGQPVGPLRRALQRSHVDRLIELGIKQETGRTDVNVMAWGSLKRLHDSLKAAKSTDELTALHYEELATRIEKALNAIQTLGSGGGGGRGLTLADLLGGSKPKP